MGHKGLSFSAQFLQMQSENLNPATLHEILEDFNWDWNSSYEYGLILSPDFLKFCDFVLNSSPLGHHTSKSKVQDKNFNLF